MSRIAIRAAVTLALLLGAGGAHAGHRAEAPIHAFAQDGGDGLFPVGGVVADAKAHHLYGTTSSGGAGDTGIVYQLADAGHGAWTASVLYAFTPWDNAGTNADGAAPEAGLLRDSTGHLFGTTSGGGLHAQGVVFELAPPSGGGTGWTQTVLWTFSGGHDGAGPQSALVMDAAGNLYGTTTQGGDHALGTVFELVRPSPGQQGWTETVLYSFAGMGDGELPRGRLLLGSDGTVYGTTPTTVFRLAPTGTAWGFSVLHTFAGGHDGATALGGLIQGADGTLYGTTAAGGGSDFGTVFSMRPDGSGYAVLWEVDGGQGAAGNGPTQALAMDAGGALYGSTRADGASAFGEIFELLPPKPGRSAWKAKVLHAFALDAGGQYPQSDVLLAPDATLYGTTYGTHVGESALYGTVWRLRP